MSDTDTCPGTGTRGEANRPCSRRLDQMKNPPYSNPRTFTIVRRRFTNTYQRPRAGFSPRWLETSAHRPSKLQRMSVGAVDSQMPPDGQPPSIRFAAPEAPHHRRAKARHPSPDRTRPRVRRSHRARLPRSASPDPNAGASSGTSSTTRRVPRRSWTGCRPSPRNLCAVERRVFLAGANPAQQLSLRLVAAAADHGGNDMV